MSSLSLRYPRKPWELADDIESFIYIPVYMTLRFHRHAMTKPKKYPVGVSVQDLRKKNATNRTLATRVFSLFWEEEDCEDGYVSGGTTKNLWIENGKPPVELTNPSSPLAALLQRLYVLLHEHYKAVNYADLERFKCRPQTSDDGSESELPLSSESKTTSAPTPIDNFAREDIKRARDMVLGLDSFGTTASSSRVLPRMSAVKQATVARKYERVLDSHQAVAQAFDEVMHENGVLRDFSKLNDKWIDQFDGLRTYVGADDKKSSGSSKRKRGDDEVDNALYEVLKKRVRGDFGWRVALTRNLETTPEEGELGEEGGDNDENDDDSELEEEHGEKIVRDTESKEDAQKGAPSRPHKVKTSNKPTYAVRRSKRIANKREG